MADPVNASIIEHFQALEERAHHLAHPVHHLQSGLHRPAALCLALPPDAPGGGPRCPVGHPRWAQFRMVCGHRPHLPHGPVALDLCSRSAQSRGCADAMWPAAPAVYPGG